MWFQQRAQAIERGLEGAGGDDGAVDLVVVAGRDACLGDEAQLGGGVLEQLQELFGLGADAGKLARGGRLLEDGAALGVDLIDERDDAGEDGGDVAGTLLGRAELGADSGEVEPDLGDLLAEGHP